MIGNFGTRPRAPWVTNVLALLLSLAVCVLLLYVCRSGPPSRTQMGLLISILLLTPSLINWRWGWPILFCYFPFAAFIRRIYMLYQPGLAGSNDPLIILPDLLMASMAVGFLVMLRQGKRIEPLWGTRPLSAAIVALMVLCLIEVFNPMMGSIESGLNGLRQFTLWMMLYFLVPAVITKKEQIHNWIYVTLFTGTITGLYGAYQYIFEFPVWDRLWAEQNYVTGQTIGDTMRAFSTFSFTSTFSQYMIIAAIAATMALRMRNLGNFTRLLSPFFLACCVLGLGVTFVRSSYIGLIVAWVIGLTVGGKKKNRWLRLAVILIVSYGVMSVMPHTHGDSAATETATTGKLVTDRMLTMTDPSKVDTFTFRLLVWQRVIDWSWSYPAGVGIGAGGSSRFGNNNYIVSAMAYTESQVFSMLAEVGWPGLILYMYIVLYGLWHALRVFDRVEDPDLKRLVQLMIMLQMGIFVAGVSGGTVLYTLPGCAFYWAALGMVNAISALAGLTAAKMKEELAPPKASPDSIALAQPRATP
jgi:hypothetical protein